MYYENYQNPRMAAQGYARLGVGAAPCLECTNPTCVKSCPYDVPIPELTRRTAKLLG